MPFKDAHDLARAWDYLVRGRAPVANATDEASAVTQLNALLASLRAAGVLGA